jgi:rubrerythrin
MYPCYPAYDYTSYPSGLYYDYRYFRQNESHQLVRDLVRAINGEYSAVECYGRLADMAPNQAVRDQILEIQQDERNHLQAFTAIYRRLTGRQPAPEISGECPDTYREGIRFAFRDEQETVDFYLEVADRARDPSIQEVFRRAAADEQNHAVWFLYFLVQS